MKYYLNLTSAIADINNGTDTNALADSTSAKVMVNADTIGRECVILLDNLTENAQVDVNQSVELVLNGKVLTFSEGFLSFGAGTACVIDAEGGQIVRTGSGTTGSVIVAGGEKLIVKGGRYGVDGSFTSNATAVKVTSGRLVLEEAVVNVSNGNDANRTSYSRAVQCNPGTDVSIVGGTLESTEQNQVNALVVGGKCRVEGAVLSATSSSTDDPYNPAATIMPIGTAELTLFGCAIDCSTGTFRGYGVYNNSATVNMADSTVNVASQTGTVCGIYNLGSMELCRCSVSSDSVAGVSCAATNGTNCQVHMVACAMTAHTASSEARCVGLDNFGSVMVECSTIFADSCHGNKAVGASNGGICYLINTDVTGNHSGCSNHANLYVQGGTFTGWTHGGLYFAPGDMPGTEGGVTGAGFLNYVNDAYMRCGYFGQHVETIKASATNFGACAYLGSGSEIEVFMDNCIIGGIPAVSFDLEQYSADIEAAIAADPDCGLKAPQIVPHAIALRHALGERNNVLHISNSSVLDGTEQFRIDNASDGSDLGHRLYVGMGTNITEDKVNNKADTIFAGDKFYRRNMAWFKAQVEG